jgi:hypothetical protein
MFNRIVNGLVVVLMGAVLVLFEFGRIEPGDAFFIASAIVVVFTGQQLIQRKWGSRKLRPRCSPSPSPGAAAPLLRLTSRAWL